MDMQSSSSLQPASKWWTTINFGSTVDEHQQVLGIGNSYGLSKGLSIIEHLPKEAPTTDVAKAGEKGSTAQPQFTIFPDSEDLGKPHFAISSMPEEYHSRFELGINQPVVCAKYPNVDLCYGFISPYSTRMQGRIMLPLSLKDDDGPIFVNAKQYHGIIRRRIHRENQLRRVRKPYMHESRHRHAMRRPRGSGGRFLNTKTFNDAKEGTGTNKDNGGQLFQPTYSSNSEVLQSDNGTLNSSKDANGSKTSVQHSAPEVTSMYSRGGINPLSLMNHSRPTVQSIPNIMSNAGHGIIMPNKVCCNMLQPHN